MTRERIITAILTFAGLALVVSLDWAFDIHLGSVLLLTIVTALALSELYPMLRRVGLDSSPAYGIASACLLITARGLGGWTGLTEEGVRAGVAILFAAVVISPFLVNVFRGGQRNLGGREEMERAAVTILGLLLVWYLLAFLLELRLIDDGTGTTHLGLELCLVLVLAVKVGDSTAYLVGRSFGVTPLSWISPKKTWEGAAGSVAGSVAVTLVLGWIVFGLVWWQMLLFGILVSVAGQLGDLLESLLKRQSGVKDSGGFFRESGGFLDLVDSLLLAGPVGYLFVRTVVL